MEQDRPKSTKEKLRDIIFEAETPMGKLFDVTLFWLIVLSVTVVCLDSVASVRAEYGKLLKGLEWGFTILFSIEYLTRIWLVTRPLKYMTSFYGVIDLLSCLPTYLALFVPGFHSILMIRVLRLLRIFRVLRMARHVRGAEAIMNGILESRGKIMVFFFAVFLFCVIAGTMIYVVESGSEGTPFTNIPISIYYAIVSITTVGYGDLVTTTVLGKMLTSVFVLTGYAIIAVPTGIVTSEILRSRLGILGSEACGGCGATGHLPDAKYCRRCGEKF